MPRLQEYATLNTVGICTYCQSQSRFCGQRVIVTAYKCIDTACQHTYRLEYCFARPADHIMCNRCTGPTEIIGFTTLRRY